MPFFSSVEPSAVPFFFRNFPAFSSQTFHTRPAATAYPSRRHRRRHCCLLQRQRRYMRLGRCHGTLEAECDGSIAPQVHLYLKEGRGADRGRVDHERRPCARAPDARSDSGLCRRSRNWGVVQRLACASDRIAVVCQRGKLLDFCICRLGGWWRRRSVCVDVMIARQCAR